jgi:hypothetical protein
MERAGGWKRCAGALVAVGFVSQPQLDRIHGQGLGQLVERAFHSERGGHRAGSAYVGRRACIQLHMMRTAERNAREL